MVTLPIIGQVAAFISGITVAGHLQKVSWTFTGSPCRCGFPQQWKVETYEDWGAACQCYDQHDGFLFQVCGSTPVAGSGAVYLTFFSVDVSVVFSTPHSVHRILSSCKFSAGWVVSRTPFSPAAPSPLGILDAGFSFLFERWFYFLLVWSSSCSRPRSTGTRSH